VRRSLVKFKVNRPNFRSWAFAGICALILGGLVLLDQAFGGGGGVGLSKSPCQVQVTADVLNVRNAPDPNGDTNVVLHKGDRRGAQNTVQSGYRKLADGWALDAYLKPLPGSTCGT
jgi:hypothetical protein